MKMTFLPGIWAVSLLSCGGQDLTPAAEESIRLNEEHYNRFLGDVQRVRQSLVSWNLSTLADEADSDSALFDYLSQIDRSPLLGDDFDYLNGVLHRAFQQILYRLAASVLDEAGMSFFALPQSDLVEALQEDTSLGVYRYVLSHGDIVADDCDQSRVLCSVAIEVDVSLLFEDQLPSLENGSGFFGYRLLMDGMTLQVNSLTLSNGTVGLDVQSEGSSIEIGNLSFNFNLLSSMSTNTVIAQEVVGKALFHVFEVAEEGLDFRGNVEASLDRVNIHSDSVSDQLLWISDISGLDVDVAAENNQTLGSRWHYQFFGEDNLLVDGQAYPYRFGLFEEGDVFPGSLLVDWQWSQQFYRDSQVIFSLEGQGSKTNNQNIYIEDVTIKGAALQNSHQLSADIRDDRISSMTCGSDYWAIFDDLEGGLVDPSLGYITGLIANSDGTLNWTLP